MYESKIYIKVWLRIFINVSDISYIPGLKKKNKKNPLKVSCLGNRSHGNRIYRIYEKQLNLPTLKQYYKVLPTNVNYQRHKKKPLSYCQLLVQRRKLLEKPKLFKCENRNRFKLLKSSYTFLIGRNGKLSNIYIPINVNTIYILLKLLPVGRPNNRKN